MILSDFSIRKPVITIVLILGMMLLGILALSKLRVNQSPDIEMPVLVVQISYPGASPETGEREIVDRIEKALQTISGVYAMQATANEGMVSFNIQFDFDKNMVIAGDEVRNAINSVRHKLPIEMREPVILRIDTSQEPVMQLALSSSTQTLAQLSRLAEDKLADELRGIEGVANVDTGGAMQRELSVLLHSEKLRAFGVSVAEVQQALRTQNMTAPVGKLKNEFSEQGLRLIGRIERPEEFEKIIVKRRGSEIVYLSQVATIEDGVADVRMYSRRNSKPNVSLSVQRTRDSSAVSVAKLVREKIVEINKNLPTGTALEIVQDGGEDAQSSLNNVIEALVLGAGLTIFVVYVFLNSWRSTLITSLSLPTSVLASFIAVWACGFSLNFMTLLGLSLAIGVLIDDAIVVRENIVRHMERGADRMTAARNGTAEIGLAVAATTFSIIAVFVPVAFMEGMAGEWFRPFGLTVVASVMVSLFISFTVDPMLSAYWGDPPDYHHQPKRGLSRWLQKFNVWFDHQADRYGYLIRWALGHRKAMGLIALFSLVLALVIQNKFGGTEVMPAADFGSFRIDVRTPPGTSPEYARLKTEQVAELARQLPEFKDINARSWAGGGRIYVDIGEKNTRQRDLPLVAADMRQQLTRLIGAEFSVLENLTMGGGKPVFIQFYGPDSRRLMEITNVYMERLRHEVKGAVEVSLSQQDPRNELQIELDRSLAANLGISMNDVAQALRVAYAGLEIGDWIDPSGETRDVSLRLHPTDRADISQLENLPIVPGGSNAVVPLGQIAKITMGKGPAVIQHMDGMRMVGVTANVQGRAPGEVNNEAMKLAQSMDYPPGFGVRLQGAGRTQKEIFTAMGTALVTGILIMYFVLVIQFGSFLAPAAIMLSLPLSLIGVVIGLVTTNSTLNLMSFIGVIMLMGLVAKNAILLIDCARKLEAEGHDREEALMEAGRKRLRPILMTTFALVAGMMPVAISTGEGGEMYQPMAIAIIGGVITSTLLTLLVVPTFYDSIELRQVSLAQKHRERISRYGAMTALLISATELLLFFGLIRFLYRQARDWPQNARQCLSALAMYRSAVVTSWQNWSPKAYLWLPRGLWALAVSVTMALIALFHTVWIVLMTPLALLLWPLYRAIQWCTRKLHERWPLPLETSTP